MAAKVLAAIIVFIIITLLERNVGIPVGRTIFSEEFKAIYGHIKLFHDKIK